MLPALVFILLVCELEASSLFLRSFSHQCSSAYFLSSQTEASGYGNTSQRIISCPSNTSSDTILGLMRSANNSVVYFTSNKDRVTLHLTKWNTYGNNRDIPLPDNFFPVLLEYSNTLGVVYVVAWNKTGSLYLLSINPQTQTTWSLKRVDTSFFQPLQFK